ncbi:NBAS subunit of NRZ tethering complex-like isoform X2 [Lycorma delicatula]|uniref:NBAS subunit of NRZ tethering complex-like isoform X2 n=1 Tax=Lycorma delicatula TaxID=130591 RepID=UPI003F50ECCA
MIDANKTDNILYELLVYSEWTQEPDVLKCSKQGDNQVSLLTNPFSYFRKTLSLTEEICRVLSWRLPWKFAAGEQGKVVAILQDNLLEIRTSRDEYSSVVGKAIVGKDNLPQWRRLAWSPDCSMLAVASSNGSVHFYDLLGSNLFNIPPVHEGTDSVHVNYEKALASILFISSRTKNPKWSSELVLVDYSGYLRSYFVSPVDNFLEQHTFILSETGIASVEWHPSHNLLFVSSLPNQLYSGMKDSSMNWGLCAWRLLNDYPYYKLAVPTSEEVEMMESRRGIWRMIQNLRSPQPMSVIFGMQVSQKGNYLACLHTCGTISVWTVPGLKLYKMWSMEEQADSRAHNPSDKKYYKDPNLEDAYPIDLSWWPDEKLIIARKNGAVSVCELNELHNLLGDNPEFLCGEPALSTVCTDRGFLALECDTQLLSSKRKPQYASQQQELEENQPLLSQQISQNDQDSNDEEEMSILSRGAELVQLMVYFFTDIEQFRPKKKRPKIVQRIYRLLGLKSTTPEELFTRRIDSEEYGEALALAYTYGLDTDRVYQRQWRNSPVSVETIHEYLGKISKYDWVLQECCERVPETLSAAKELINFGLNMTESQLKTELRDMDSKYTKDNSEDKTEDVDENAEEEKFNWKIEIELLDVDNLTEEIKRLILTRLKLLQYSDRLYTYQLIISSDSTVPDDNFDREFYNTFRQQDIVLSAIEFARQGNFKAVEYILTYHGSETLKYWLKILGNFPETMLPSQYSYLLPECSCEGDVFKWKASKIREEDWCESEKFKYNLEDEDENSLMKSSISDSCENLSPSLLTEWYKFRIYQLEQCSHLVDPPLDLMKLARERNIKGLDELYHQLLTLDVLVYELNLEDMDLEILEKKSPIEKCLLLLSDSDEASFIEDMLHRVVPFLNRCEGLHPGSKKSLLSQLIKSFGSISLSLPLKLFQYCQDEPNNSIISTLEDRVRLTLDCLYAYTETEELDKAFKILRFLPDKTSMQISSEMEMLCKKLDNLESELDAAVILHKHGHPRSLLYIHNHANDLEIIKKLVLRVARATANKVPSASENEWNELLSDILKLQKLVFTFIPLQLCYELYVSTVLASGNAKIIRSAMKILCCCGDDKTRKPLSFDRSVFLVLQAAREYFDSAGSLTDPNIQYSKTCLNLIIEENEDIQEELDLIQSLQILHEFGVNLLPMQVRLSPERMRLVESCLQGHPSAYRNQQKLLTLAEKLHVCGKEKEIRKGKVLFQIAEAAFLVKDYVFCSGVCKTLVEEGHSVGWKICQKLGQCSEYRELSLRQKFIAFALLHCPPNSIHGLIQTRCDLEREALQFEISSKVASLEANYTSFEQDDEFVDALTSPSTPSKEFLPQLATKLQSTTKFLTKVAGTDFWKNSLNLSFGESKNVKSVIAFDNSGLKKQGFPDFYSSLHPGCYFSSINSLLDFNNVNEKKLGQYNLAYKLLQSALLEIEKDSSQSAAAINSVLIQCSQLIMSEDSCLGLAFLFSLTNETAAEQSFCALPQSLLCLQLALYYYSVLEVIKTNNDVFSMFPEDVISLAFQGPPQSEDIHKLLQKYRAKLENYMQAEKMKELNCGVNIDRFTEDSQYKQDSILGLAMCQEWEKVELALELGQMHGVSAYEVAVSHIISLLLSGNHQLTIEHIADNKLASLLQDQPNLVQKRLTDSVFPSLNGCNHQLMIAYYTVLQCVAGNNIIDGLHPKDHIKLIKKVKATSSAIDYKGLLKEPLLSVLRPALNKETAANIARLLKTLPQHIRGTLTVSQLYMDLLNTDFFYQCLGFSSENESINQFNQLRIFFSKVSAEDLIQFVKTCIFSRSCAQQLSPATRADMISEVIGFCLQYKNSEAHAEAASTLKNWSENISNIWSLSDTCIFDESIRNFLIDLDITCGEVESVRNVIETALSDKIIPFSLIENKTPKKLSVPTIISELLKRQPCPLINMTDPCWSSILQEFTSNSELSPQSRLLIVSLLQKLTVQPTDSNLQLLTEAVLGKHVNISDVSSEGARSNLFFKLLKEFNKLSDLCTLKHLLLCWPSFSVSDPSSSPSLQLILKMVNFKSDDLFLIIGAVLRDNKVSEQDILWLIGELESSNNVMLPVWICLLSSSSDCHMKALLKLEAMNIELIDEDIVRRLVELGLAPTVIESSIYTEFIESLIILGDITVISETVQQLIEADHVPEAGHLLLIHSGVPPPLRTFSAALAIIEDFKKMKN